MPLCVQCCYIIYTGIYIEWICDVMFGVDFFLCASASARRSAGGSS